MSQLASGYDYYGVILVYICRDISIYSRRKDYKFILTSIAYYFWMFALTPNPVGMEKSKHSIINRVFMPCLIGLLIVGCNILAGLTNYFLTKNIDNFVNFYLNNSILYFFVASYMAAFMREKIQQKITSVLSPLSRKIISKIRYWFVLLVCWYAFVLLRATILKQFTEWDTLLDMTIVYSLYALLFSLFLFSFAVSIPTGKYLSSKEKNPEERKLIADSVTFLTPLLGIPWAYAAYFFWSFLEIPTNLSWVIYVAMFLVYILIFFAFVDLPYYSGARDKKSMDLEKLDKKRDRLLEELQNLGNSKNQDLLKKIVIESEMGRIDREKQVIESRSLHPYKLIIPTVSLLITVFVALLIELLKGNLPQLIGG